MKRLLATLVVAAALGAPVPATANTTVEATVAAIEPCPEEGLYSICRDLPPEDEYPALYAVRPTRPEEDVLPGYVYPEGTGR